MYSIFDATIKVPFGLLIYGSPMSGKSSFIKKLLINQERLFSDHIDQIVYFYGEHSRTIEEIEFEMPHISLVDGLPDDFSSYIQHNRKSLFIFDDLMQDVSSSKEMVDLVTKKCQHKSISWIVTFQNAFHQGPERVNIARAAQYLTVFNSPLDKTVPHILANRIMPSNRKAFLDIFQDATQNPFGYLFCDGHPLTPANARLRSDIFGDYQLVYVPAAQH